MHKLDLDDYLKLSQTVLSTYYIVKSVWISQPKRTTLIWRLRLIGRFTVRQGL